MLVIFLCQIAIGVFAFLEIKDEKPFREKVEGSMNKLFNEYGKSNESTDLVNVIQSGVRIYKVTY